VITLCPTILAEEAHGFRVQLKRVESFARRLHIDLMDGTFASPASIGLDQVYWPGNIPIDLHVMYKKPFEYTDALVALGAQMIIVHAEAEGDFAPFADRLHHKGIEVGVALLPETPVTLIEPAISLIVL
jgi:ribulose-phosphate 3-epimerase